MTENKRSEKRTKKKKQKRVFYVLSPHLHAVRSCFYDHGFQCFVLFIYLFLHLTTPYDALGDKTQDKDITILISSNTDK